MTSRCSRRTIRGALPLLRMPSLPTGTLTLSLRQQTWRTVNFSDYRVVILNWDDTVLVDFITPYTAAIPALEAYAGAGGVRMGAGRHLKVTQGTISRCPSGARATGPISAGATMSSIRPAQ